ncbi:MULTISPECIES: YoaK family protein [unclassified Streptomyces]|uniref:YoaK family protein n=1 Tax=unclassified Streptomyces TaxID=2593676 RepID=UPI000F6CEE0D|nr:MULTISPECIES: YoaK family protein [unclassified Streptomyces]AZM62030.1 DUF1275 domain-containing protein [Streptomyces sp. WAC 01438]RSM97347.1 DUF1275 domain-containing protein [Streptomyces sp. WAC 01420]
MSTPAARTRIRGRPVRVTPLGLLLALTFATGVVDAVGYLRLDQVFAGNMTGNVVILAMAVAGGTHLPVLAPAAALVAFLVGAATAGRVLRTAPSGWGRRCTVLLAGIALLLSATALALPMAGTGVPGARALMASALALAMGMQAATARHLAVKDVTTVVVTSTLTALAADSRWGAGRRHGAGRRTAAVALLIAGAITGAVLTRVHDGLAVAAAALVALAVCGLGHTCVPAAGSAAPVARPPGTPPTSAVPPEPPTADAGVGAPRTTGSPPSPHPWKGPS